MYLYKFSLDSSDMYNWGRGAMKILFLLFTVFTVKAVSQDTSEWLLIDCGSETSYRDSNGVLWQADEDYIKTGKNKQISQNTLSKLEQLYTLRVFTKQNKNCYTLPTPTSARYFIRAMFNYGNHDGLSKPPSFDLQFDGNKWATVVTSMTKTTYYEMIYATKGDNISVCLAQTQDKGFPFISILEAWPLPDNMYKGMSRGMAWLNSYRYNYGATEMIFGYPVDDYNRIWEPMIPSGLEAVTANFTSTDFTIVDDPPDLAIIQAVQAPSPTETIDLPFKFSTLISLDFVVLYFTEIVMDINATRSFDLYVNNEFMATITPEYKNCTGELVLTQSIGTLNVELQPTENSTLPPIISALEVYTASDPLVTTGTAQDDLDGLATFINTFEQLQGWSGEPCLPSDTVWQWLGCAGDYPPRVTSINLSGYGLNGPLPEFSEMEALETIDLGNNSLDGPIPAFLGKLPNLQILNLRDNNFSGDIPQSIINNKKIRYSIEGNQSLHHPKRNRLDLILGLAIGLPLGLIMVIVSVYFLARRQEAPGQVQAMESGRIQGGTSPGQPQQELVSMTISTEAPQQEFVSMTMSTEAPVGPSENMGHMMPLPNGESIATSPNAVNTYQPTQANEYFMPMASEEEDSANTNDGSTDHPSETQMDDEELLTNQPTQANEHSVQMASGEVDSANINDGSTNHPPETQMDEQELYELLQRHGNLSTGGRA